MWNVESIRSRKATLDFSSSGRPKRDVVQVMFDGVTVANAIELTSWADEAFQVFVCEACGFERCEPGNWLVARKIGEYAAFAPAFEWMEEKNGESEYSPPTYVEHRGVPMLTRNLYEELREPIVELPEFEAVSNPSCREAALLLKAEAPAHILGGPHQELELRKDALVGVSAGDLNERIGQLEELLVAALNKSGVATFVPGPSAVVTFYLDIPGFSEWEPMAVLDATPLIRLEPGINLAISGTSDAAWLMGTV